MSGRNRRSWWEIWEPVLELIEAILLIVLTCGD